MCSTIQLPLLQQQETATLICCHIPSPLCAVRLAQSMDTLPWSQSLPTKMQAFVPRTMQNCPIQNNFWRKLPEQILCSRDRNNRQVPDRRGDGATATNSIAGMRGRGCDESCVAADPEHVAAAAALLERFKAKTKSQPFELQVRDARTHTHGRTRMHACTHTNLSVKCGCQQVGTVLCAGGGSGAD